MKIIALLVCIVTLFSALLVVSASDDQQQVNKPSSLRTGNAADQQASHTNDNDIEEYRDLMELKDIWGEVDEEKRRGRRYRPRYGGYGGDDSKGSKSSKGSKGSKGGMRRRKRGYRRHDDDDDDDCYDCDCHDCKPSGPVCETIVYEFAGQTGSFLAEPDENGAPIENVQFALYAVDDNIYRANGNLNNPISDPAVFVTGKCMQVRLGKFCSPTSNVCCEGLTMCDLQFSLSDDLGAIGDIVATGGLTDNMRNTIPITAGFGGLQRAYGNVEMVANYVSPIENEGCPNISEVDLYNVAAKIYVEVCEDENVVFAATGEEESELSAQIEATLKRNKKRGNP